MPYYKKNTLKRIEKFFRILQGRYYEIIDTLQCTAYVTKEPVRFEDRLTGEKKELKIGDLWGELFDCAWFHFQGKIPQNECLDNLVLLIDISGEGLCWDEEKGPVLGITNGSVAWENAASRKRVVPLSLCKVKGTDIELWMDGACNGLFGSFDGGKLREAHIARLRPEIRDFYYDFFVLKEAMENLSEESPRYYSILYALNAAINEIYDFTEEEVSRARKILQKELSKKGGDPSLKITAIGHSHIDLAWLWPIRETIRKAARTFSTVLHNMEKYPDYVFGVSQPQLLQWVKEYYPTLFERFREKIKEGRIECQGAMWVEADTNLIGGESLVRQILYGQKFWKEEFGIKVNNIWLPDVFGYTGALPQIMKKSGLPYFMTQKLSWNEHNTFPHHTFIWSGIDGSKVLVHMLPEETYNSHASPATIRKVEKNYLEKGICDEALVLFGVGDGGGGPGAGHLEKLSRLKNLEGFSPIEQGFASDFFRRIDNGTNYPLWKGELYLEYHRGTYTSQARNKKYNRKLEFALRELEFAAVHAMLEGVKEYPQKELEKIWKEVLLYQFHDILPGSSIKRVYDESLARYAVLLERVEKMIEEMYGSIFSGKVAVNSLPFSRHVYIKEEGKWYTADLPALSSGKLSLYEGDSSDLIADNNIIENNCLRVEFNNEGEITSIYDKKNNREVLRGNANQLCVYNDQYGDAWDIDITYDEQKPRRFTLSGQRMYIDGPNACMEQTFTFGKSVLVQTVILQKDSPILRFDTKVDWHESEKMLRTAFPVCVDTDEVTCNIQFGNIKRPTHRNTSWDMTRFEICAHKWIDLSQDDYGVALLNDCKYGFKVLGNVMDINLLRSSVHPGIEADQGEHYFSYALFPHAGNEKVADVENEALAFNVPIRIIKGTGTIDHLQPLITIDQKNIGLSSQKKAEESDDVIIRLFESKGIYTECNIGLDKRISDVKICNLMEEEEQAVKINEDKIKISFKPYEIITLKLTITR